MPDAEARGGDVTEPYKHHNWVGWWATGMEYSKARCHWCGLIVEDSRDCDAAPSCKRIAACTYEYCPCGNLPLPTEEDTHP